MNILPYIETHIVDHCNLNCKGCSHFSPLSDKWFQNLESFENDILQLRKLVDDIKEFRIMGGEPLLHPNAIQFAQIYRKLFPESRLAIVTNGLLLRSFIKKHFKLINSLNIEIHITEYPTKKQKISAYIKLLKKYKINYNITQNSVFFKHISILKTRPPKESFEKCRQHFYCPALKNGKIYQCSGLAYLNLFKNYFNLDIGVVDAINIFDEDITFKKISDFINSPNSKCELCFYAEKSFNWSESSKKIDEWVID